ncbi:ABC transporter substrate-binding protein [Paraburkholderia hospita]|uniref:ABC transporter substrate-binding protein n=1 Tax=Paraburkholderia hospita TaxID=169430 RepID=A0AAN1MNF5_9BURK|nr:ABC transporter substrate-binding protein [Paraburkholderia hospita]AUT73598.1 ABC transporter substrate-binding protein [Paraburkholderia hospita]OUL72864.1 ABC transporter substrate-binding protein [Paraburkholderia hospita]OUL97273.1 ABC transporter substrate-binding protein [Paraburkholderia hospita]SEH73815.1 dipeptide transport system substrate-binding protein [Paraburkholderia hospita]
MNSRTLLDPAHVRRILSRISFVLGLTVFSAAAQAAPSGTLVFCSEGSPAGFDPGQHTTSTDFDASTNTVYNELVQFRRGTLDLEPALATSWDVSADQRTYTFHLRKGVKFQTTAWFKPTREFNADDVLFTFNRMLHADDPFRKAYPTSFPYFSDLGFEKNIESIERVDDTTVRFRLKEPDVIFVRNLAMSFASILSAEYAAKLTDAHREADINQLPVGTGPFAFRSYQKDAVIRYDANPDYWRPDDVKLAHLVFSITPDPAARIQKLANGECQVSVFPRPADLDVVKRNPSLTLVSGVGFNVGFVAYNTQHAPLNKLDVRRALDMAIDKPAIIQAVFSGNATVATNPMPPAQWSYDKQLKDAPHDPAKAKALLAQAGFPDGFDLTLWAMPVQRPYNPNAHLMAQLIQQDWAKIGVRAKIVSYEWGEYNRRAKQGGEHDAILYGWSGDNGDPDNWLGTLLGCAAVGGSNVSKWCDPAFNGLIEKARETSNTNERTRLYEQAQVIFKQQVPYTPVAHSIISLPASKRVSGLVFSPLGSHRFDGVSLN